MTHPLVQHTGSSIVHLKCILSMFLHIATLKSLMVLPSQLSPIFFQVFGLLFYMYLSLCNVFYLIYRAYLRVLVHYDNIWRRL